MSMTDEEFDALLNAALEQSRQAFEEGPYAEQLAELSGLSASEMDAILPGTAGRETYEKLMTTVKLASAANMEQAKLRERIIALGESAVAIARRIPSLAAFI